ncbi:hypothetical protein EES44_28215 [Streptomyces sp. ADI96-15]|nr:hypothetical protein EES44_28215 [Streptomyces sp. ADI96-15]
MSDPASSVTAARFRAAVEAATTTGDLSGFSGLFLPDVRLYSPVSFKPFDGEEMVLGLLGVLVRTFEDFRYIGTFTGEAATSRDQDAPASRRTSCSSGPPWTARRSTAWTCSTSTRPA